MVTSLLLAVQWGGNAKPWNDPTVIALLVLVGDSCVASRRNGGDEGHFPVWCSSIIFSRLGNLVRSRSDIPGSYHPPPQRIRRGDRNSKCFHLVTLIRSDHTSYFAVLCIYLLRYFQRNSTSLIAFRRCCLTDSSFFFLKYYLVNISRLAEHNGCKCCNLLPCSRSCTKFAAIQRRVPG